MSKLYDLIFNKYKYKKTIYPNLYKSIDKDRLKGYRYLMKCKIDGVLYNRVIGYSEADKLTDKKASEKIETIKQDIEYGYTSSSKITLNKLFEHYFETLDPAKKWSIKKKYIYMHYVKDYIGSKSIEKLREMDIRKVLLEMSKKGLSPRTQKSVLEVLNPLFKFAVVNKYLKENPSIGITVKIPNQKKIVTNATELFNQIYKGIITLYANEPFYRALFLFGFTGRRKTEILTLKWENIDFKNDYYWIDDTKNDDNQKYQLPLMIKEQLLQIIDYRKGLVFKSPKTGKQLSNIDRQFRNLIKHLAFMYCDNNPLYQAYTILKTRDKRNDEIYSLRWDDKISSDIKEVLERYDGVKKGLVFKDLQLEKFDKLSPHYMRNVLVSMLAEQKTEAIVLSGILGHKDTTTINKYLSINHYKSSQEGYKKIDEVIDVDIDI